MTADFVALVAMVAMVAVASYAAGHRDGYRKGTITLIEVEAAHARARLTADRYHDALTRIMAGKLLNRAECAEIAYMALLTPDIRRHPDGGAQ